MEYIDNKIELCFNLLKLYEDEVRRAISVNGISKEEVNTILKDFKFKNDILFSLNKEYKRGDNISRFCEDNNLDANIPNMLNFHHSLYKHQENAIKAILDNKNTIVSTGTGSGKTESFLIPIFDYCIKNKDKKGVKAIIIYPMNALAGDQLKRIESSVKDTGITYAIFNGQTPSKKDSNNLEMTREEIVEKQPDILITNYIMLDRILTNTEYSQVFNGQDIKVKYIVLDEIHSYNGNKALHIKFLLNRLRSFINNDVIQIGSSATLSRTNNKEKTDGYINGDINEFIVKMFDLKSKSEYSYIEPVYEAVNNDFSNIDNLDDRKLAEDIKTQLIREFLYEECRTLDEILNMLENNNIHLSDKEIKEYFSKILKLNLKYSEKPILDFRVHIFLLEIGKSLKRCVNCGKYYTLNMDKCNECGHIILPVYKEDTSLLLGYLDNGQIKPVQNYKDFFKDKNIVLLDFNKGKPKKYNHVLNFNYFESNENSLKLVIDKDGPFKVYKDSCIEAEILKLNPYSNEAFKYKLIENNLHGLKKEERKKDIIFY